jgi:hypothetical protein
MTARDDQIARLWLSGETQQSIATALGMSPSGISRVLDRIAARWDREKFAPLRSRAATARPRAGIGGRPPVWPDCPAHLLREYRALRAVIGSVEAKKQLQALAARDAAEGKAT